MGKFNKIVHIMPEEKITGDVINILKETELSEYCSYIIVKNGRYETEDLNKDSSIDVYYCDNKCLNWNTLKLILESKSIVFHSLIYSPLLLFFFLLCPLRKKTISWFIWGTDLYSDMSITTIKMKLRFLIKRALLKKITNILTPVYGDYELACDIYNKEFKYFSTRYMDKSIFNERSHHSEDSINILLGNSATKSNNHIDILKILAKYKNDNIEIICPLSYGDTHYAQEVSTFGKKIFGNKFFPLESILERSEYNKMLSSIEIAIFNFDRQQGIGNINALLYLGAKVYIRKTTTMWNFFNQGEVHGKVFSIDEISSIDFENFIFYSKEDQILNRKYLEIVGDRSFIINEWNLFFKNL